MREKKHRIMIKTSRPISRFERWLQANCEGGWNVKLIDVSEDLLQKTYAVTFDLPTDARAFRNVLPAGTEAAQANLAA